MKTIKTIDLGTRLLYSKKLIKRVKSLIDVDILGFDSNKNNDYVFHDLENIIFRVSWSSFKNAKKNDHNYGNYFLIGSILDKNSIECMPNVDILTVRDLYNVKSFFKKYGGKNIGMEYLLSDVRYFSDDKIGKWFSDMKWIYEQCMKYNFQFIFSSGASKYYELLSSKVFNAFLLKITIEPKKYWNDLNYWLDDKKSLY